MTIKLTITENFAANTVLVDSKKTPYEVLGEAGVDMSFGMWNLDGGVLTREDMNTPLEELGCSERAYLTKVAKTDNAR